VVYPDGSRVLELSTRCSTGEAFQVAAEARAFLAATASTSPASRQTKTRKALGTSRGTCRTQQRGERGGRPRWEWRTFDDLDDAERHLRNAARAGPGRSDETYLLSRLGDASVKIRGGVLGREACSSA
jgi:hypothetical protein